MRMKLTELFQKKEFVITGEVGPVKGCSRINGGPPPAYIQEALDIKDYVHAVNVTDNQGASMRLGALAASVLTRQFGLEPIFQITCRDRNRLAIQSDLLAACTLGIDNVLCLTGDHIKVGDHKTAKPVFDIDSVHMLKIASGLNAGYDMMGNKLSQASNLALGAAANPNFEPLDLQLIKMENKVKAGCQFFQTQPVYEPKKFEIFMKKAEKLGAPVMFGMVVIKSPGMAKFINDNVTGIHVPAAWIKEMDGVPKEQYKKKATEMTIKLLKELAPMCQGIHFMPFGWSDIIPEVLAAIKPSFPK
jgi:methylenetetrahydrofolate reductase (NADPH)